jgi:transcriptional regulator with XRE-family HTH domain
VAIDGEWMRQQLKEKGKSQADLARFLKVEPAIITRILQGRRRLQLDDCRQIARFLGMPVDDVLRHAGMKLRQVTASGKAMVPIIGRADANGQVRLLSGDATTSMDLPGDAVAIRLDEPEGWTAFATSDRSPPDMMIRRMVMAAAEDGGWWIGELRRGHEPGLFDLKPLAGRMIEGLAIAYCQAIVWIRPA